MTIRSSLEQVYIQIIRLLPLIALLILLRLLENLHPVLLCIFAWNISSASSSSFSVFLHRWMLLSPFSQSLKKREINCYVPSLVFSFLFSLSPFLILWKFLGLKLFFFLSLGHSNRKACYSCLLACWSTRKVVDFRFVFTQEFRQRCLYVSVRLCTSSRDWTMKRENEDITRDIILHAHICAFHVLLRRISSLQPWLLSTHAWTHV